MAEAKNVKNGNGKLAFVTKAKNAGAESMGFALAEGVSLGVGLGVMAFADKVAPWMINGVSSVLAKTVVEPLLEPLESARSKLCKLEECQVDTSRSREERAQALAKTLLMFGVAWYASMEAKVFTRTSVNKAMGLAHEPEMPFWKFLLQPVQSYKRSPNAFRILAADEGVHYGSLLLLNTGLAQYTDDYIRATTNMLANTGLVSKEKAHELATYGMVWEAPNVLGLGAGIGAIAYNHFKPNPHI